MVFVLGKLGEDLAEALRVIAEEMAEAGMAKRAKQVFDQALKVAEEIEGAEEQAKALRTIAEGMATARVQEETLWRQALKVGERIEDTEKRAKALREMAERMARVGEVEGAVGIMERETGVRREMLSSVLRALAERARKGDEKSKKGFLRLLPWCGWSLELAYEACGWLAWLHPEQAAAVAEVLNGTSTFDVRR
jgi:ribosomal protein L17